MENFLFRSVFDDVAKERPCYTRRDRLTIALE